MKKLSKKIMLSLFFSLMISSISSAMYISVHPTYSSLGLGSYPKEKIYLNGSISSEFPIGNFKIYLNNRKTQGKLYIGNVSENNLNGKWEAFGKFKKGDTITIKTNGSEERITL